LKRKKKNLEKFEINQRRLNNLKINHFSDGKVEIKSMWLNKKKRKILKPRKIQNKSIVATNKFKKNQISHGGAEINQILHKQAQKISIQ
jgi:hypothetical protein